MTSAPPETAAMLADTLRGLAFDIETRGTLDANIKQRAIELLQKLHARGFDVPLAEFTAAPGSFDPRIVARFIRRYAERLEYSEEEKTQATARAEATIARWIHRFELVLDIPRGHIRGVAHERVPAHTFADFVLQLERRIGRASIRVESRDAWALLQQSVPDVRGIAGIGPEDVLPRGLACSVIARRLQLHEGVVPIVVPFRDVPLAHPSFNDVALMRHLGIVSGWYTDNLFRPERPITYFELAKIIANVFRLIVLGRTTPTRIFFAHSGKDKNLVRRLKAQLETRGVQSWMDEERVTPGENVSRVIEENINAPDVVVVAVISKDALQSKWVQYEIELALAAATDQRPKLVPLKIDECEMPESLLDTAYVQLNMPHATDVEGAADFERACEDILAAIEDVDLQAALKRADRS